MLITEIVSGDVTTPRAKRILVPMMIAYTIVFALTVAHSIFAGYSGLARGTAEGTGYSVVEHGIRTHVTWGHYWLAKLLITLVVVNTAIWFIVRAHLSSTGDLRRGKKAA